MPAWLCPCAFHWTSYMCSPSGLRATLAARACARDVMRIYLEQVDIIPGIRALTAHVTQVAEKGEHAQRVQM